MEKLFTALSKLRLTEPNFLKLMLAKQISIKNAYT